MTPDRARRKALQRQYAEDERARARASLGLAEAQLKDLLAELDESIWGLGMPCDHTLGRTEDCARRNGLDVARVLEGVRANSGGCDCEVGYNARPDRFGWRDD